MNKEIVEKYGHKKRIDLCLSLTLKISLVKSKSMKKNLHYKCRVNII